MTRLHRDLAGEWFEAELDGGLGQRMVFVLDEHLAEHPGLRDKVRANLARLRRQPVDALPRLPVYYETGGTLVAEFEGTGGGDLASWLRLRRKVDLRDALGFLARVAAAADDAQEFCNKLNAKSLLPAGWQWALPTEAQWEYACRAGTTGDYAGNLGEMAWYTQNADDKTHPVATKKPNAWGLYDMHGNVLEWCADWYGDYPAGSLTDPTGSNSGSIRVFRGGSWHNVGTYCRSAARDGYLPGIRYAAIGFRVAAVPGGS